MENHIQTSSMKYQQVLEHVPHQSPNIYQLPVLSNSYQPLCGPLETSLGCPSRSAQSGLQMSAFNLPQNLIMVDQQRPENQSQTVLLKNLQGAFDAGGYRTDNSIQCNNLPFNPSPVSTSQVELTNPDIDWINPAYERILQLKQIYLCKAIMTVNRAREMRQQATDAARATRLEKTRIWAEDILNFMNLSRSDLLHRRKDQIYKMIKDIILYFTPKALNALRVRQTQQVEASSNHLEPPQMQQRENYLQFNNTSASLHQSLRLQGNSVNSFTVSSSARVHKVNPASVVNSHQFSPMRYTCLDNKQSSSTEQDSLMVSSSARVHKVNPSSIVNSHLFSPMGYTCLENTQSSSTEQDSLMGFLGAVKRISSSADKSTLRDTSNCGNENFSQVCRMSMNSRTKRQSDNITWNELTSEADFCPSGGIKRLKKEPNDHLSQEIQAINRKLIEVVVNVMNVNGSYKGTLIRCSYVPVGQRAKTKAPSTSSQMFPNMFVDMIVAADYPTSSPIVLERMAPGCSDGEEEGINLCKKAKAKFSLSLAKFPQPISLKQMAETWNSCAREVFVEFAEKMGGGDFSSKYGKWEVVSYVEGNI